MHMNITSDTEFTDHYDGDIIIRNGSSLKLTGTVSGNICVESGCTLILRGKVFGDVIVMPSGRARISGAIGGTLHNNGGIVRVRGEVDNISTLQGLTVVD